MNSSGYRYMEHRSSGRNQIQSIQNRVMKSVSDYNRQLNQERKEDRRVCMDLQTYTIQYPVGLGRDNKGLRRWIKKRCRLSPLWQNCRRYPVALLPNQYQDWFLQYTPQELKYLPLNTVLHGPTTNDFDKFPPLLQNTAVNEGISDSDIDGSDVLSDLDDDSTCSCGEVHCVSDMNKNEQVLTGNPPNKTIMFTDNNSKSAFNDENSCPANIYSNKNNNTDDNSLYNMPIETSDDLLKKNTQSVFNLPELSSKSLNGATNTGLDNNSKSLEPSNINNNKFCKYCKQIINKPEDGVTCADCEATYHSACLEISGDLLEAIRLYPWQCQDCKMCYQCRQLYDEDKMLFCDKCDRGYHNYCVGLKHIPQGEWVCSLCAVCSNCGTKQSSQNPTQQSSSGEDNNQSKWKHEFINIHTPDGKTLTRYSLFCETCYQLRKL